MNNTADAEQLNKDFSIDNDHQYLSISKDKAGIVIIKLKNQQASASISLQGAHLLSWKPAGQDEVIWLSEDASFAVGKSVRGGIPICWPWFGAHETDDTLPAHGFARTVQWQLTKTRAISADETQISFKLDTTKLGQKHQAMWPHATTAEYIISIGKKLSMKLITYNNSKQAFCIGQALHSYFNVNDINHTVVHGLDDKDFLDKPDGFKRKTQSGPVVINGEVDRIYLQTADDLFIDNSKRKIKITKQGSSSTVVWNPGPEVAEKMGDLGHDGFKKMLCVESANAADDCRVIEAGQRHELQVCYQILS